MRLDRLPPISQTPRPVKVTNAKLFRAMTTRRTEYYDQLHINSNRNYL